MTNIVISLELAYKTEAPKNKFTNEAHLTKKLKSEIGGENFFIIYLCIL